MSISLFYPDNQKMASRCQQLIDNITNQQDSFGQHTDNYNIMTPDIVGKTNEIMAANGYHTYTDLINAMLAELAPADQERLKEALSGINDWDKDLDITFGANVLVGLSTGVTVAGFKAFDFVRSGALSNALSARVKQVTSLFSGEQPAADVLTETDRLLSGVTRGGEEAGDVVTMGSKVARFGKVIGAVSVALDVFLVGLAAWEGAQQEDELITNIHYLNVRRVLTEVYEQEAQKLVDHATSISGILQLIKLNKNGNMDDAIAALKQNYIEEVQASYATLSLQSAQDAVGQQDSKAGAYLDHDLSFAQIQEEIQKEVGDPVEHSNLPPK